MDREPLYDEITSEDTEFANQTAHWDHIANQVGRMTGEPMQAIQVRAVLSLLGVSLRSASKREIRDLLGILGIRLSSSGGGNVEQLMAHDHGDFVRVTEEVPDELQSWKTRCNDCGEERRILRG